ncbi:MAG TPA: lytic transglycosylase domain-containing protein [Candidatus Acidoferrum sp.]|nr:lytic transglycosylase domain-containing protein [Candidatus Acidoferrum sp.]
MNKLAMAVLAGGLLLLPVAVVQAAVYVYVDSEGTAHFTDAPTNSEFRPMPAFGLPPGVNLARGQYAELINAIASEHSVDPGLVKAIIQAESNFDPQALSRKGAQGLMQLMPGTAGRYAVTNAYSPEENIRAGVRYLRSLHDMFPGRMHLVLAAYNAGENAVMRYDGIPPYPETREYVRRVLRFYGSHEEPAPAPVARPTRLKARNQVTHAVPSTPGVFRRLEPDGTVLYTDVPPLVRSSKATASERAP